MPLSLEATTMVTNAWSSLATTTAEDTITITNANPTAPALIQFTSTVAWSFADATGTSTTKIPVAAGGVLNLRVKSSLTVFVQNQSAGGFSKVAKLAP